MRKALAIIGAGPKAAAIVARAAVLRDIIGPDRVPHVFVYERDRIGGAWVGGESFSSGFLTLCTPGEKDVGFPYNEISKFDRSEEVSPKLFANFSWSAYLVAQGRFADWVDRDRDHPSHRRFADYLDWVFDRANQDVIPYEASRIERIADRWRIRCSGDVDAERIVDGVVLTGAGEARRVAVDPGVPQCRVFDAETFWAHRHDLVARSDIEVAVAGDGGAAGTIVAWLAERFAESSNRIWSVSRSGTLFPRGDGHAERRWFSWPEDWPDLSLDHRKKIIDRTEAGVVSLRIKRLIDRSERVEYKAGNLRAVRLDEDHKLAMVLDYEGTTEPLTADYLVNAIGFDPWSRLKLVDLPIVRHLAAPPAAATPATLDAEREKVALAIDHALSLPTSLGYPPGLHVPALAGLAQGPGMGNLGCLGLMAARVLDAYLD